MDTGTPQTGDLTLKIGPLPDLQAAYSLLTAGKLDVLFLVDTTGSFGDDLPFFKADSPTIMANIKAVNSNTRFALATFRDFPFSPWGDPGDYVYKREIDLTWDTLLVENTIQGFFAGGGNDLPESQLEAIYQSITGEGVAHSTYVLPAGLKINFRPDAVKIIALWTDAAFHKSGDLPNPPGYPGASFTEVITAIESLGRRRNRALAEEFSPFAPRVVGVTFGDEIPDLIALVMATGAVAPPAGVDCDGDGTIDIPEGQPIICPGVAKGIGSAFVAVVESVIETLLPVALCKDITLTASATECSFNANINNGSYDPNGSALVITQSPPGPYEGGVTPVNLHVVNEVGLTATCTGKVTVVVPPGVCPVVETTLNPVALCKDITLTASATECSFNADINNGSYDPKGSALVITQSPPGPYGGGVNLVNLQVKNEGGLTASCTGKVTVTVPPGVCPVVTNTCDIFLNIPLIGWLLNLVLGWFFCWLGWA